MHFARILALASLASVTAWHIAPTQDVAVPAPVEWDLQPPAPVADERVNELAGFEAITCAECHADQTREWASSRHALAWVNERYQEELAEMKRPDGCHGCHIPKALHAQDLPQKPATRPLAAPGVRPGSGGDLDPHFGVTCTSCHEGKTGDMLGPFDVTTDAHFSAKSDSFLPQGQSRLCIACHATSIGPVIGIAKDFVDTQQWTKGKSCVGCHMQQVERPIARESGKDPYPTRTGRSHALQTPRDPAFLRRALSFEARQGAAGVSIAITNECGHRVPGLVDRTLAIEAELVDAAGGKVGSASTKITNRNHLAADARIELSIAGRGVRVRLRGLHEAPGFAEPVEFLDQVIDVAQ